MSGAMGTMPDPSAPCAGEAGSEATATTRSGTYVHTAVAFLSDQAVCSAGNFMTSLLAARTLGADQFGVFALLNIIIIFSLTVNNWLIRANLSKTSQVGTPGEVTRYTSTLSGLAAVAGLVPAAVLVCATLTLHHPELWGALCVTAVATQVQETMRRSAMAQSRFRVALAGDAVSYLGQCLVLAGAVLTHRLSLSFIFWTIGATSMLSAVLLGRWLMLQRPADLLLTARTCWEQGRWITLSGVVLSPIVYGMPWIIDFTRGQVEAGVLSGLILVLGISNPVMFSSTWLLLVRGQAARHEAIATFIRQIAPTFLLISVPLFLFWGVVFVFPRGILELFYSHRAPYAQMAGMLRFVVAYYVVSYGAVCLEVVTDTREKSRNRVWIDVSASLLMLSAGLLLSAKAGLAGLLAVGILAHLARVVAYAVLLRRPALTVAHSLSAAIHSGEVSS